MFKDCLGAKEFMLIILYVGIILALLMKEPRLREVKSPAQCQTSSKWWCQDVDLSLPGPTYFLLHLDELPAAGGMAGGRVRPITHSTEDRASTQQRAQQRQLTLWGIWVEGGN